MKNSYVPNEKGKKVTTSITAIITAAAILVGGTLIAKLSTKDKKHVGKLLGAIIDTKQKCFDVAREYVTKR